MIGEKAIRKELFPVHLLTFSLPVMWLIILVVLACIPLIIFVERAQRRIPVNYAKRVQGRKMMGGQSTWLSFFSSPPCVWHWYGHWLRRSSRRTCVPQIWICS